MSITDELRKYANRFKNSHDAWSGIGDDLTAIADRIDAEHQKALDEWKAKHGQMWLKGYSECHAELLEGNETLASDLERCGWIRLPKDADGEYTNADDEMFWKEDGDSAGRVTAIGVGQRAGWVWTLLDGCNVSTGHEAFRLRHHHAPTVEDVLREFICDYEEGVRDEADLIAEYATKLKLAEEDA